MLLNLEYTKNATHFNGSGHRPSESHDTEHNSISLLSNDFTVTRMNTYQQVNVLETKSGNK